MKIFDRLKHAWNAFVEENANFSNYKDLGYSTTFNPSRPRFTKGVDRSIVTSVYSRIAIDCSEITLNHVKLDKDGRMEKVINSGLNNCLTVEANKDQTAKAFIQDIIISLFDEGVVAIVPIDIEFNDDIQQFDIETMRTGKILQWYPDHIKVEVYNDRTGLREQLLVQKDKVAIVENPLYAVMNEKNSVLQRLIRKLNLLDAIDEQSGSGKLDLIIQLPYIVKSTRRKEQANQRRLDIEEQLTGSKYGVAYTDGTEKITQLNRPIENNLLKQIEYLTGMLFSQLGITKSIMDGSANETEMLNYTRRTVGPIIGAVMLEMTRKFISKDKRKNLETLRYFMDPFALLPIMQLAEVASKLIQSEVVSSNEIRNYMGLKPSDDPEADKLRNKNINPSDGADITGSNKKQIEAPKVKDEGD